LALAFATLFAILAFAFLSASVFLLPFVLPPVLERNFLGHSPNTKLSISSVIQLECSDLAILAFTFR
jgi:hypothetical protein